MRSWRIHLWWIIPVVILVAFVCAGWVFYDTLRYGDASSLHRAVMKGDHERVKRLIARGADVNARMKAGPYLETWGATPMHLAARRNSVEMVEELIHAGADKEAADDFGYTPLHAALVEGADAAAQHLLHANAKLRPDPGNRLAGHALWNSGQLLRTALGHASLTTVRMMLDAGADPRSDIGDSAMAFVDGPDRLPKLQMLFDRGFSVQVSFASNSPLYYAAVADDVPAIVFLLDHGADIEAIGGHEGFTPLLAASFVGSNDVVRTLLERGANPKAGTGSYGSPIYAAAFSGKRETVRLLLSMNLGIDLQAGRASDKATPLHFAYWNNDTEMADLLIKAGALPDARTTDGRLPKEYRR
jgi:ankyrin repeat protein